MENLEQTQNENFWHLVEEKGPWPFITRRVFRAEDGAEKIWSSRHNRKGLLTEIVAEEERLAQKLLRCLWMPGQLNWWIGSLFAIGSLLFVMGSVFSFWPGMASRWSLDSTAVNAIYFAGSIFFTTAAYLQLYQAANASGPPGKGQPPPQRKLFGWRPHDAGWLSCALQFIGTVLFNFNTFDAMIPSLTWFQQDLAVWAPNLFGSLLFLASGYLAYIETCHGHWGFKPRSLSWWVVFINFLGCLGFIISAVFAVYLPGTPNAEAVTVSVWACGLGAVAFFFGSLLMLPESVVPVEL